MPVKIIFSFLFCSAILPLFSLDFRYSQEEGMVYRIVSEVQEGVWEDSRLMGETSILNRIGVSVSSSDSEGAVLDVEYSISEKSLDTGLYIYNSNEQRQFYRSNKGIYGQIPQDEYLPSVRNIPVFPEKDLEVGDSWSEMAEEVHDLKQFFGIDYRVHIPFRVFYTYVGTDIYNDRPVDIIHINYHYLKYLDLSVLAPGNLSFSSQNFPEEVSGDFKQIFLWDRNAGIPAAVDEEFEIRYRMRSGIYYTFKGIAEGKVVEADHWTKSDVLEKIEDAVRDMDDVSVALSSEGVVLTLEDIHFQPDSADFLQGEEEKLYRLKDILLQFPDHDLLITGHTARIGNSVDQGQALSEDRAEAVASYLLDQGVRLGSQMVIQGKGSSEPVGDNSQEEGRRKNRRVEITILDN